MSRSHLFESAPAANISSPTRARIRARQAFFVFFAFTSSLYGRISLKTSILRVKVSPFAENDLSHYGSTA